MTADPQAAEKFYCDVIGWRAGPAKLVADYTLFFVGEEPVCGLMTPPPDIPAEGAAPHWSGYIAVDDIDHAAQRITEAGGSICREPWDVAEVGRMLVAADPVGARFMVMRRFSEEALPPQSSVPKPGRVAWHELHVPDAPAGPGRERALAFYSTLFGWSKGRTMDMGEAGPYQIFQIDGHDVGGIMNTQCETKEEAQRAYWMYYFTVESIDAGVERVKKNGGSVLHGPVPVPDGGRIALCRDPQGAHFSLFATS